MKDIDAADLAFVVHDGDFWWDGAAWTEEAGGLPPCSDEAFQNRLLSHRLPAIPSSSFPATTSGPIATGQSRARTTRSRG